MNFTRRMENLSKIYDAAYKSGNPDKTKGFAGWQKRAQITRGALLKAKEERDATIAEWSKIYTNAALTPKLDELNAEYNGIKKLAIEKLDAALDEVIAEKRGQFRAVAMAAPSDEQLRTLQTLSLRDDLTEQEVCEMAENMSNSLQAMRALGSIARKAGLYFPKLITNEEFEDQVNDAASYARSNYAKIDAEKSDLGYNGTAFYNYTGVGMAKIKFEPVDTPLFAAVQAAQKAGETKGNTTTAEGKANKMDGGEFWSEVTLNGDEYLETIADQFHTTKAEIKKANPSRGFDGSILHRGDKILVPSTRMKVMQGRGHVQEENVKLIPAPVSAEENPA